jgi:hypothetical protein
MNHLNYSLPCFVPAFEFKALLLRYHIYFFDATPCGDSPLAVTCFTAVFETLGFGGICSGVVACWADEFEWRSYEISHLWFGCPWAGLTLMLLLMMEHCCYSHERNYDFAASEVTSWLWIPVTCCVRNSNGSVLVRLFFSYKKSLIQILKVN